MSRLAGRRIEIDDMTLAGDWFGAMSGHRNPLYPTGIFHPNAAPLVSVSDTGLTPDTGIADAIQPPGISGSPTSISSDG